MLVDFLFEKKIQLLKEGDDRDEGAGGGEKTKSSGGVTPLRPHVSKLLCSLGAIDIKRLSDVSTVEICLTLAWMLMWGDSVDEGESGGSGGGGSGEGEGENEDFPRLLGVFAAVMKKETAVEHRIKYVDYCLNLVTSKREANNKEDEANTAEREEDGEGEDGEGEEESDRVLPSSNSLSTTKRQMAFRLLQTVVHTMDFSETNVLVDRYNDFIQTLIDECQDFATSNNSSGGGGVVVSVEDSGEQCLEDDLGNTTLMDADSKEQKILFYFFLF